VVEGVSLEYLEGGGAVRDRLESCIEIVKLDPDLNKSNKTRSI